MLPNRWMNIVGIIVLGLVLKFGSPLLYVLGFFPSVSIWYFLVPYLLGTLIYIGGCCLLARAKNRHELWGSAGLLCVLGLPILIYLEDRAAPRIM